MRISQRKNEQSEPATFRSSRNERNDSLDEEYLSDDDNDETNLPVGAHRISQMGDVQEEESEEVFPSPNDEEGVTWKKSIFTV